jgi:hypothetical protein
MLPRPNRGENEAREPDAGAKAAASVDFRLDGSLNRISHTRYERVSNMMRQVCAAVLAIASILPVSVSSGRADGLERGAHRMAYGHHFAGWKFGPRSEYARVRVIALFDSCWRYRDGERIWTCGNYVKPNAEFDWGYGHSIADQARYYVYPW